MVKILICTLLIIIPLEIKQNIFFIKNSQKLNEYSQDSFSGVIYFTDDGVIDNMITKGIWRKIHRLQIANREGTEQEAKKYNIQFLPTFIFIEKNLEVGRYVGIIPCL